MMGLFRAIERGADFAFEKIGTPAYVTLCVVVFAAWIFFNVEAAQADTFDPYPFILLNLVLSAQAMITAPLIMIAQRKAENRDRDREELQRQKDDEHNQHMLNMLVSIQAIVRAVQTELEEEDAINE